MKKYSTKRLKTHIDILRKLSNQKPVSSETVHKYSKDANVSPDMGKRLLSYLRI